MENTTINFYLDKRTPNKNGAYPIKLIVIHDRKNRLYSTNQFCSIDDFETVSNLKKNPRGKNKEIRGYLQGIEKRAKEVIKHLKDFTFDNFKNEFYGISKFSNNVFDHFDLKIEKCDKIKTATNYRTVKNSLMKFKPKLEFKDITPQFLKKYDTHLSNEGKSSTTKSIYTRAIRTIVNDAIKNGIKMEYPFGKYGYTPPSGENVKKALIKQEVFRIIDYKAENPQEQWAKDVFVFSFISNGMNIKDIAYLKYKQFEGNNFKFIRQKTKGTSKKAKEILCKLTDETKDIIDRNGNLKNPENFVFNIIDLKDTPIQIERKIEQATQNVNKYLKRIATKVGIEQKVTTYSARHSFASILHTSNRPIGQIKDMLGHTTLAVTMNYLDSIKADEVDENIDILTKRDY